MVPHPHDISVQTFRGHTVLQTLIRAYFSPAHSTGQRFVYTGSADGTVRIYGKLHPSCMRVPMLKHTCLALALFSCSPTCSTCYCTVIVETCLSVEDGPYWEGWTHSHVTSLWCPHGVGVLQ